MQKKRINRQGFLLALSVLSTHASHAEWNYLNTYNSDGVPDNMLNRANELPSDILSKTYELLPEYRDVRNSPANLITDDAGANIYLKEEAEVTVYFVHEGAWYKNGIAFFTFDPDNKPGTREDINEKIFFPNVSSPLLQFGDSIKLGTFQAGQAIGFTVAGNGWKSSLGEVNPNQPWWSIFTSLQRLNPERYTEGLGAHTVLLAKEADELLVIGFEDMNRYWPTSDHDFNDVILAIKVTPFSAVDRSSIISFDVLSDADGDGIPNYADEFPNDPERASTKYYPSATSYGHIAFEDNWPDKGDYDMNDLVVAYRSVETRNADNEVVDLKLLYEFVARGADFDNGFAIHIPGLDPSQVKLQDGFGSPLTTVKIGEGATIALAPEENQQDAVFIIDDNVTALTQSNETGCPFYNTEMDCQTSTPIKAEVNIHFTTPQAALAEPPFNPFIFRTNDRGLEIHLVDHPATDLADSAMFSSGDDDSTPAIGRYYRTQNNHPWALDIPHEWEHPLEYLDINIGYPKFYEWAESQGQTNLDWYTVDKRLDRVFPINR